jgi:hypothetical protein
MFLSRRHVVKTVVVTGVCMRVKQQKADKLSSLYSEVVAGETVRIR